MQTARDVLANIFGARTRTTCEVCGNEYDKCFDVQINGEVHTFDCFECAVHALAPHCVRCGCSIIGHGVEANGAFYCSTHCARQNDVNIANANEMRERSPA